MRNTSIYRNRGMSLIEVLVGMVIGLIGIVIIMQIYLVNENFKRSTTAAGSAQINSSIALYSLERDVMSAGYGIGHTRALGCNRLRYFYNGAYSTFYGADDVTVSTAGTLPDIRVAPVVINAGGASPDSITVMYAGSNARAVPATVATTMGSAGADIRVDNVAGFFDTPTIPNDLIMIASVGGNCTLAMLKGASAGTGVNTPTLELRHNSDATGWNPLNGGTLTAHSAGALVFNLGKPTVNVYSIDTATNKMQLLRLFTWTASNVAPTLSTTPAAIVDDIVDMRAQYGKDTNADGIVDLYDNVTPSGPTADAGWKQVLSIRVAVLARSQNYEKPATPGGACTATTVLPTWSGSGTNPFNIALPSCYTYRVLESVVPLRNMIWSRS